MKNQIGKFIILLLVILIISSMLYSYDDRIDIPKTNDDNNDNLISSNDEQKLDREEIEISIPKKDEKKNNVIEKPIDEKIEKPTDIEKINKKTFQYDKSATYYKKKNYDILYEKKVYSIKVTENELENGHNLNFSFYKFLNDKNGNLIKIESYDGKFQLKEFSDFIYENNRVVKVKYYDNFAKLISKEVWNYDGLGQVIEIIYYNEKDEEDKIFLYDYDISGNEIIRIEKKGNEIIEKRYSYYNQYNQLIRREYYNFGRLVHIYLYDYSNNLLYRKRMYDSQGILLRIYNYRNDKNANSNLLSLMPIKLD